ncbi:hypothetical protein LDL36_07595 [Komagataeibacter sp. FNDCR1]|nr:hypothetical protein [Komagataeibacter sp. FNDCR1]
MSEMDLAVRISIITGKKILVPAASFYETDIARSVLEPFFASDIGDRFNLVGSGSSVEEFRWSKADQYRTGSMQHTLYSSILDQAAGWQRRERSATKDITGSWIKDAETGSIVDELHVWKPEGMSPTAFARAFIEVPEKLGGEAFIAKHVEALLPLPSKNINVTNTLHQTINYHYFNSYVTEFKASVFQNMNHLGGEAIPSGNPKDDIDFSMLVKVCRGKRILDRILRSSISHLDTFCYDTDFIEAFNMSQTSGYAPLPVPEMATARFQADLAILTALPKEREAVEAVFGKGEIKRFKDDPNVYKLINFEVRGKQKKIVVGVLSEMGNTRAGSASTDFLRSCAPERLWMIGIAGGCPRPNDAKEDIRLGDIVIADSVWESDFGKMNPDQTFENRALSQRVSYELNQFVKQFQSEKSGFDTGWIEFRDKALNEYGLSANDFPPDILHGKNKRVLKRADDPRRKLSPSIVHFGGVAASNTLLKSPEIRDELRDKHKIKAVEMESAGLRDAGWSRSARIAVFRGIVDYCDAFKNDDWHNPAAISAAAVARFIFEAIANSEPT